MKVIRSTCNYCSIACNLDFHVEDDGLIKRVVPTVDYPVNKGFCCVKGLNLDKQNTEHENPVLPLVKDENGELKQIQWQEAFDLFAKRVTEIQEKYGKESFAFLSTGQLATEEMALAGHIGRTFLGGNGDGNTRLCMATSVVAYKQSFGFDAPPYTFNDLEHSDVIIFIGCNPVVAHPILWGKTKNNKDCIKIAIDPRRTETVTNCDMWIDIKPKSDLTLLYTLANVLIEKGWIDNEYIEKYTEDFEGFKEHVKKYTLEDVEEKTGISKVRVLELAEIIHNGKRVSLWWTMGVNQSYQAVRTAQAIINIALMTGNIGRLGTGANSITGQCNAMGSRLFSNTTGLYGGGEYDNEARRKVVAEALDIDPEMLPKKPTLPYNVIIEKINSGEIKALWVVATNPIVSWINNLEFKIDPEMLPKKPTLPYNVIIEKINSGEIKALWVVATNPIVSWINNLEFKKAAEKLEFLVVEDIYSDTETARYCDLLLPSANGLKKEGVLINTERRLSKLDPVLEKKENELTDYDIMLGIGKALGMGKLLDKWKTPRDAFETLKACTKGMPCDITGVDYDMLKDSRGVQWPFRAGEKLEEDERRLFEDNKYYTPI